MKPLRLLSYLAPSIPEGLFRLVASTLQERVGLPVTLEFESRVSGPAPDSDPFREDRVDLAFACGPSYGLLKDAGSPVELLPVAPVFAEPRAHDRPVYFSDVIGRSDHPARRFEELAGATWSYNDRRSRSGWLNMVERLAGIGHRGGPETFFGNLVQAGSHLRSIVLVAEGLADAAAIDSNALWLERRRDPDLNGRLRVLESWGPMPIQPLIARAGLDASVREKIAATLLAFDGDPLLRSGLETFGVRRFAPVNEESYRTVRALPLSSQSDSGRFSQNPIAREPPPR